MTARTYESLANEGVTALVALVDNKEMARTDAAFLCQALDAACEEFPDEVEMEDFVVSKKDELPENVSRFLHVITRLVDVGALPDDQAARLARLCAMNVAMARAVRDLGLEPGGRADASENI